MTLRESSRPDPTLEKTPMTSSNEAQPSKKPSPEQFATAFNEILEYITPLIAANPDAVLEPHCPQHIIFDGTPDDAWREGQRNGEIYAARKVLDILSKALGTTP